MIKLLRGTDLSIVNLESTGILYTGALRNIYKSREVVVVTKNAVIVVIIGCTNNKPGWNARKTRPGTFYVNVKRPVLISNMQVNLAVGAEYRQIVSRIKQLSEEFNTDIYEINGRLKVPVRKPVSVDFINRI
jgi:hypothetical protein